jgi:mannobiose 2-epimerase
MTSQQHKQLLLARSEIKDHLENGLIRFWKQRGRDPIHGGILCRYDSNGDLIESESRKSIISQTRGIWGFANFYRHSGDPELKSIATQALDFFIRYFWDNEHGGWYWMTERDGTLVSADKVVYGLAFAIYALSEYTLITDDPRGIHYAELTFDLLNKYSIDAQHGGFHENQEPDWQLSGPKALGGDRKTLNSHMHIMEAFTLLYQVTHKPIHRKRLEEIIALILGKMLHPATGCCMAQFDLALNSIPAISLNHSWDFERQGTPVDTPEEATCYGHNVEFSWLLVRAGDILGKPHDFYKDHVLRLCDHAIKYGVDHKNGGVYCSGPFEGAANNRDKEFWENMEVIPGFLDAFEVTRQEDYLDAFFKCWNFSKQHMINHRLGEWIFLAREDGTPLWSDLGNNWKINYHSGRSMTEALHRLDLLLK